MHKRNLAPPPIPEALLMHVPGSYSNHLSSLCSPVARSRSVPLSAIFTRSTYNGDDTDSILFLRTPIPRVLPFHGFADVKHRETFARLSLTTSFSMNTSIWRHSIPENLGYSRNGCEIIVEEVQARLDACERQNNPFEINELRLTMGPSWNTIETQLTRLTTAHFQSPSLTDITISSVMDSREFGIQFGAGHPGTASFGSSFKRGETLQRPPECVGLQLKNIQVGVENGHQFFWKYPVSKTHPLLKKLATFSNHRGTIAFPPDSPPDAIFVRASMICNIPRSFRNRFNRIRGLLRYSTIVRDENIDYPCRQVRFCLQTNIFADEDGKFKYPDSGECGISLDLGRYCFKEHKGVIILEAERPGLGPSNINNPHESAWMPSATNDQNLLPATIPKPGTLAFIAGSEGLYQQNVEASLEFDLPKPREKKRNSRLERCRTQ